MKIYIIKHKGADIARNLDFTENMTFSDGDKIWVGQFFWRLKDAKKYLNTLEYKEFREIKTAEIISKSS